MNEEHLNKIYSWARGTFQKFLPEDLTLFKISWPTYLSILKKTDLKVLTYEAFESQVSHQEGFAYPSKSRVIAPIIYALSASSESLSSFSGELTFERIQGIVRDNLTYWEVGEENKTAIINHISHLLEIEFSGIKVLEEGGIDKTGVEVRTMNYTHEEILRPNFEFKDLLEINLIEDTPLVTVNGQKILGFEENEILFALLLYLAAARKKTDGWLHLKRDLQDEGGRNIAKIRKIFSLLILRGIPPELRKKIIKIKRGKAEIRLALESKNITIGKGVAKFNSRHESRLIECMKWAETDLRNANYLKNPLEQLSLRRDQLNLNLKVYQKISTLIERACKLLGQELKDPKQGKLLCHKAENIWDLLSQKIYRVTSKP